MLRRPAGLQAAALRLEAAPRGRARGRAAGRRRQGSGVGGWVESVGREAGVRSVEQFMVKRRLVFMQLCVDNALAFVPLV